VSVREKFECENNKIITSSRCIFTGGLGKSEKNIYSKRIKSKTHASIDFNHQILRIYKNTEAYSSLS